MYYKYQSHFFKRLEFVSTCWLDIRLMYNFKVARHTKNIIWWTHWLHVSYLKYDIIKLRPILAFNLFTIMFCIYFNCSIQWLKSKFLLNIRGSQFLQYGKHRNNVHFTRSKAATSYISKEDCKYFHWICHASHQTSVFHLLGIKDL